MANRRAGMASLTVERRGDLVVLTMTPQLSHLMADSIELGDGNHTAWLDSLADLLRTAADRNEQSSGAAPAGPAAQSEPDAAPDFTQTLALATQAKVTEAINAETAAFLASTIRAAAVAKAEKNGPGCSHGRAGGRHRGRRGGGRRRRCGHGPAGRGHRRRGRRPGGCHRDRPPGNHRPDDRSRSHPQLGQGAPAARTRQFHRAPVRSG